jgi:transcriptional regulator with XRE-family HTH domain
MAEVASDRRGDFFRALLLDARKKADMTQAELADVLQRPQSFVSKYESGERRLDVLEFLDVADALGINLTTFFRDLRKGGPQ